MKLNLSRRSFIGAAAALVPAAALAGCNGTSSDDGSSSDQGGASSDKTLQVVCTNESYKALFDMFTKDKGMPVEFVSMSSGDVLSKLRAEGGTPSADLWFGGGIDSFMAAAADGLLEAVDFPDADRFAEGFKSPDNYWFSKGVTVVGFIANDDLLKEVGASSPAAWTDLVKTEYKDEIVMSSPAVSGTNYAAVAAILQTMGETDGWKYLEELNANIPFYTKRGSDPATRVSQGEIAVGITYLDRTLDDLLTDGIHTIQPTDGMPYMPDGVAAFKGAANVDGAKEFIEWLFSSGENLKELAAIDKKNTIKLCIPSLEGVELDFDEKALMKEDISQFGEIRDAVLEKWDQMTSGKEVQEGSK